MIVNQHKNCDKAIEAKNNANLSITKLQES